MYEPCSYIAGYSISIGILSVSFSIVMNELESSSILEKSRFVVVHWERKEAVLRYLVECSFKSCHYSAASPDSLPSSSC